MTGELMTVSGASAPGITSALPPVPWRDAASVSPEDLAGYIAVLEQRCLDYPNSPEVRTVLGMAHAVNYDVDGSMTALEDAMSLAPDYFWSRLKYGELHYRLRALDKAEAETLTAVNLAANPMELAMARKQLREIRAINPQRVKLDAPVSRVGRAVFFTALLATAVATVWWS